MIHLKTYENNKNFKIGNFVKHISYSYINGKFKKISSDEIYKITDKYDNLYEISNLQNEIIDWVSKDDIIKVEDYEIKAKEYNI